MVNPHGAVPQHQPSPTREPQCLKPRGNRPNIVGCYMLGTFAHPVACCQELLRKVFETGQTFSSVQTDATLDNVGSCCVRLHAAQQSSCDFKWAAWKKTKVDIQRSNALTRWVNWLFTRISRTYFQRFFSFSWQECYLNTFKRAFSLTCLTLIWIYYNKKKSSGLGWETDMALFHCFGGHQ